MFGTTTSSTATNKSRRGKNLRGYKNIKEYFGVITPTTKGEAKMIEQDTATPELTIEPTATMSSPLPNEVPDVLPYPMDINNVLPVSDEEQQQQNTDEKQVLYDETGDVNTIQNENNNDDDEDEGERKYTK